ncbi:Succinyl-CoA ligase [GDP-forming] subunit beta, mitochondrial [Liparis tanakae]|uniref:Succinyl-CoA ligase [GDP-forming] subunit beta, mitochondrial n=1 Tax=Liparis tanakae TaxID=230148 RepID=A0A4Z2FRW2_9TELE|nr:Succinyl-CoA ligase [GDP-forming] subunit beta, mitochondrial [Liparis tanakae]
MEQAASELPCSLGPGAGLITGGGRERGGRREERNPCSLRWLNLQEYQSKKLMQESGVAVQRFYVADSASGALEAAKRLKNFDFLWLETRCVIARRPLSLARRCIHVNRTEAVTACIPSVASFAEKFENVCQSESLQLGR